MRLTIAGKTISWKHILAHTAGIWLLQKSGVQLAFVVDHDLLEAMADPYGFGSAYSRMEIIKRQYQFLLLVGWSSGIALLLGFVLSLFVTVRSKWFWLNSLISFLVAWLLLSFLKVDPLTGIFGVRNNLFNSILLQHLVFLIIYLSLASMAFFLPPIKSLIDKSYELSNEDEEDLSFQFEDGQTKKTG